MDRGQRRSTIRDRDTDQNVVRACFGVLGLHIKVSTAIEDACIDQFQFRQTAAAILIFSNQLRVGVLDLRILIQGFHVRMRGSRIEVEVFSFTSSP